MIDTIKYTRNNIKLIQLATFSVLFALLSFSLNSQICPSKNNDDNFHSSNKITESVLDEVILKAGWNLVSLDVELENASIEKVFSNLKEDNLEIVVGFNNGNKIYNTENPDWLNTLKTIDKGYGYWVKVKEDDVLTVDGEKITDAFRTELNKGWNLISYIPETDQAPEKYFADLIDSKNAIVITGFDDGHLSYQPSASDNENSLKVLKNGSGYWVKIEEAVASIDPECGNGICEVGENSSNCLQDCPDLEDKACNTEPNCNANYGSPSANVPLLTLEPGETSQGWEFEGYNSDPEYIFGFILTTDLDCDDNSTGYNILDFNTTGNFDFSYNGPLSFDGGGIGVGCYGPSAGLYNVFPISFKGTQAELENLIFNVHTTAEELEAAILDGEVCACMPSPGNADQGLYSLFVILIIDCESEAGTVTNPLSSLTVCPEMGGTFTVEVNGNNAEASSYLQFFILIDLSFTIIEISTNGTFNIPTATGGYIVQSLNISTEEANTLNQGLVGLNLFDLLPQIDCYDISPGTGFTAEEVMTVSESGDLYIIDDYDCNENTGEIILTYSISGGSGPYTLDGDVKGIFNGENIVIILEEGDNDIQFTVYDSQGCSTSFAQVYPECEYINIGCMDPFACNYDPNATDAGYCDYGLTNCPDPCYVILGCTDEQATNYNPEANCDDESCVY